MLTESLFLFHLSFCAHFLRAAEKKKMSKVSSFCIIALIFSFFTLTCTAARPGPAFSDITPMKTQRGDVEVEVEGNCEGVGEEECLMRRTLAAHVDYIYTQKQKP